MYNALANCLWSEPMWLAWWQEWKILNGGESEIDGQRVWLFETSHSTVRERTPAIEKRALILPLLYLLCVCELSAILFFREILYHLVKWEEKSAYLLSGWVLFMCKDFNETHFRPHHHLAEQTRAAESSLMVTVVKVGNLITLITFKNLFLPMVFLQKEGF